MLRNEAATSRIVRIGREREPLCIIDDFLAEPLKFRNQAIQGAAPRPDDTLYPGLRAPAPEAYQALLDATLRDVASTVFEIDVPLSPSLVSYCSLVATPPEKLKPAQQIPHFDQPNREDLAVMHYFCEPHLGGTSFYRHRSTGFEYVDEARMPGYFESLEREVREQGLPQPPAYICGDTELFERIHEVQAKWNRLVVYRTSSLHSGSIDKDYPFDTNPLTGRFTIASFWRSGSGPTA